MKRAIGPEIGTQFAPPPRQPPDTGGDKADTKGHFPDTNLVKRPAFSAICHGGTAGESFTIGANGGVAYRAFIKSHIFSM